MKFKTVSIFTFLFLNFFVYQVSTKSYHDKIEEGNCRDEYKLWPDINYFGVARATPSGGWMIPMSSKHFAYHLGLQLTGNHSLPEKDLRELCLRLNHKGIISYTHSNVTLFTCNYTSYEHVNWAVTTTMVWTDETSNHLLMVLCAKEAKEKYWVLASSSPTVDSETKSKVLSIITELGFDDSKVLYHDHSNCKDKGAKRKRGSFFG
ncbi:hypothetical protein Ocin01_05451 [Orchesella cincta]|uniref:Apolipoprotein D n=1 Tax=Orchesella cincta TaxID=48709 RepID=A0A1D2N820_ORCCI|nr:hypothetical protein Ocin01_05451 [Orchesella cincta]